MSSSEDLSEFEKREQDCEVEDECMDNSYEEVIGQVCSKGEGGQLDCQQWKENDEGSLGASCLEGKVVHQGYDDEYECVEQVQNIISQDNELKGAHQFCEPQGQVQVPLIEFAGMELDGDVRNGGSIDVDETDELSRFEEKLRDEAQQIRAFYDELEFFEKNADDIHDCQGEDSHENVNEMASALRPDLLPCAVSNGGFLDEFGELEDSAIVEDVKLHGLPCDSLVDITPDITTGINQDHCGVQMNTSSSDGAPVDSGLLIKGMNPSEEVEYENESSESGYEVVTDVRFDESEVDFIAQEQSMNEISQAKLEVPKSRPTVSEDEDFVVENTPIKRHDVISEQDRVEESVYLKKGFAKDLAGFWSSPKSETPDKQVRQPIDLPRDDAPFIAENNPQRLEGVVRSDDIPDEHMAIEQGHAKMMVHLFQTRKEDSITKELKLDINFEEPGVYENEPKEREGIIKNSDVIDEVKVQKGVIKSITDKFQCKESTSYRPRDVIKIEPAQGPSIIENTPEAPMADVIRSDTKVEEDMPGLHGMTRNLVHKWKTNDLLNSKPTHKMVDDLDTILVAGMAAESGVFENQPTVRTDVAREEDSQPDIIPTERTRSTRDLWNQKINQESKPAEKLPQQLIRFTPPRELSPPRRSDDSFKSFQQLTLA